MVTTRLFLSLAVGATLSWSATTVSAQSPLVLIPLRVDQVMTPAQMDEAGLDRLTREQRLALDAWLTRYVAELRRGGPGQRHRDRQEFVPLTAPLGARLVGAEEGGGYVRLADGTLWEISLPDRPTADAWRARDYVAVSRASAAAGDFDHVLVNANARTQAIARFAGLVPQRRR